MWEGGRVGCPCSPLCSLLSPVPLLLLLLLFCWPCRGAGCHQRRQATKGREGEARGSLAEVKVNLPPAEAMKAREERIRQEGREGKLPLMVIVVDEHLSCFSRRPSALLMCEVNWQAQVGMVDCIDVYVPTHRCSMCTIYSILPPSPTHTQPRHYHTAYMRTCISSTSTSRRRWDGLTPAVAAIDPPARER